MGHEPFVTESLSLDDQARRPSSIALSWSVPAASVHHEHLNPASARMVHLWPDGQATVVLQRKSRTELERLLANGNRAQKIVEVREDRDDADGHGDYA